VGIKDIERFNRALRLRWLWHSWDTQERQWKNVFKISDPTSFFNSTYIQIGDRRNTPFWKAKWLHGAAPKDMAPGLFKRARFKSRTLYDELRNNCWIRSLKEVNTPELIDEYVTLYLAISTISLSDKKRLIWRWTSNGKYSVVSAYQCQF
jgi:hypothetical protein